jgi:sugar O-acyltransferase (sialic acid O-acetyltransferase NeuD family)
MDAMHQPARVVILGAGGFAREVLDVYDACNAAGLGPFEVLGFLADSPVAGTVINDRPVLGTVEWLATQDDPPLVICGIGEPAVRRRVVAQAATLGVGFHTAVHPDARLTRWVRLGAGSVVTAGCVLTNQITIGEHVHLNLNATIGHDVVIGDFVTVAPGVHVSGNVVLGAGSNIGTGAAIVQGLQVGNGTVIGAGAVVTEDIPPDSLAVGVPARVIRQRSPAWSDG